MKFKCRIIGTKVEFKSLHLICKECKRYGQVSRNCDKACLEVNGWPAVVQPEQQVAMGSPNSVKLAITAEKNSQIFSDSNGENIMADTVINSGKNGNIKEGKWIMVSSKKTLRKKGKDVMRNQGKEPMQ